MIVALNNSYWL